MINKDNIASCVNWNPRPEWERWTGSNKCPMCGGDEIEYNTQIVLTSCPPQSQLKCKSCGHIFSSGLKLTLDNNDTLKEMYEQAKSILGIPEIRDPLPGEAPYIGDWPTPNEPNHIAYPNNYGWICPKCGKVNAPHRDFCDCSGGGYYPNIVYCGGTGNNPNQAPTITLSSNMEKENKNG